MKPNEITKPDTECKGRIFWASVQEYINPISQYIHKIIMVPRYDLSCLGCVYCESLDEDFNEDINNGAGPILPVNLETRELYVLEWTFNFRSDKRHKRNWKFSRC
jgi:hypothetical protein